MIGDTLPKSQDEKRIDAQDGRGGEVGEFINDDKNSERFNDYTGNTGTGSYLHIEGTGNTITNSSRSHAEGEYNTISGGETNHIEGYSNTITSGSYNSVGGYSNEVTNSNNTCVSGHRNKLSGHSDDTSVSGNNNTVSNFAVAAVVGGETNTVSGTASAVFGYQNNDTSNGMNSLVYGRNNSNDATCAMVGGNNNTNTGYSTGVFGEYNTAIGSKSITCGSHNINPALNSIMCGENGTNPYFPLAVAGSAASASHNIMFYVDGSGGVYAEGGYTSPGADYAEYFEWSDGNPENSDRRGLLVSLDGDRISPANGDDILGVVSANPSIVGNSCRNAWTGKYRRNVFGDFILDENGERILSDEYDENREYIPRSQRPEWAAVGLVGRLVICDNGKCVANGYVTARNGIGYPSLAGTNVRCLKRLDDTHIEVLIK